MKRPSITNRRFGELMDQSFGNVLEESKQQADSACERVLTRLHDGAEAPFHELAIEFDGARSPVRRLRLSFVLAAAVAALALFHQMARYDAPAVWDSSGYGIAFGETVRTSADAGDVLKLADGSRVEVRAKSEFALDQLQDGVRVRLNSGSVIVEAAKQRIGKRLYVETRDVTVSVVGTVFLVNAAEEGSRVAVLEGEVRVQQGETEKRLLPGEQVATTSSLLSVPIPEEISWSRKIESHLTLLEQLPATGVAPEVKGSVQGVVLGAGDQPLAGAEVRALWWPLPAAWSPDQVPKVLTDKDGKFLIDGLDVGGYRILVAANGYVRREYGALLSGTQGVGTGTTISVMAGKTLRDISIRLSKDNIISGRITSTNGAPLVGMEVWVLKKVFDATGFSSLKAEGTRAQTNDRGEYRVAGVPAGRYYIYALPPLAIRLVTERLQAEAEGRAAPADTTLGAYAPTFFPGVGESSKASLITLNNGSETSNVDMALPRQQLYTIRGRIHDPASPTPPERVVVGTIAYAMEFNSGFGSSVRPYNPDGTFELADIPPGKYWVRAQIPASMPPDIQQRMSAPGFEMGQLPRPPMGVALADVIDFDVSNVQITLVRDFVVRGSVALEGRTPAAGELAAIKVELRPVLAGVVNAPVGALSMTPEGTFTYRNLLPSEFRLTLSGLRPDLYIKEARVGNEEAIGRVLYWAVPPAAPLNIVLAKGAEVRGTVTDGAGKTVPTQEVVLVPTGQRHRTDLFKTGTTDANGVFTIQGVAPGDYKAFAWKTMDSFAYFDPDFLRGFEDRGIHVRADLTSGGTANVTLIR